MDVYGLTGGIGSGKSAVAAMLEEYGIPVVSADELSRMVVAPGSSGLRDVVAAFGPEVLDDRGDLDRKAMAAIVFSDADKRRRLEAILHPRIREHFEQVREALAGSGHARMVYEVPLLFEKRLQGDMKAVILVTAPAQLRIARVCARDGIPDDQVRARMAAQMPEDDKRALADYIIHNAGSLDDLRREVELLLSRFLKVPLASAAPASESAAASRSASPSEAGDAGEPGPTAATEPPPPARAPGAVATSSAAIAPPVPAAAPAGSRPPPPPGPPPAPAAGSARPTPPPVLPPPPGLGVAPTRPPATRPPPPPPKPRPTGGEDGP